MVVFVLKSGTEVRITDATEVKEERDATGTRAYAFLAKNESGKQVGCFFATDLAGFYIEI